MVGSSIRTAPHIASSLPLWAFFLLGRPALKLARRAIDASERIRELEASFDYKISESRILRRARIRFHSAVGEAFCSSKILVERRTAAVDFVVS